MKCLLKAFALSVCITIVCTFLLFVVVNAPAEVVEPSVWYMEMTCDLFIFNGTYYIYNKTVYEELTVAIYRVDINETYADVYLKVNSSGLDILRLVVNKENNIATVKGRTIGFNPFYIFYPMDPPNQYLETSFLGTLVRIKYIRKFTYMRFYKMGNETDVVKYEIFDACDVLSLKSFRALVPVGFNYVNNTTQIIYGEDTINPLTEVYKAKFPIVISVLLPLDVLCEDFMGDIIKKNNENYYVFLTFEVPPEFADEIAFLKEVKVRIPFSIFVSIYGHVIVGVLLISFLTVYLVLRTRKNNIVGRIE